MCVCYRERDSKRDSKRDREIEVEGRTICIWQRDKERDMMEVCLCIRVGACVWESERVRCLIRYTVCVCVCVCQ